MQNDKELAGDAEPPKAEDAEPVNEAAKENDEKDGPAPDEDGKDEGMPAYFCCRNLSRLKARMRMIWGENGASFRRTRVFHEHTLASCSCACTDRRCVCSLVNPAGFDSASSRFADEEWFNGVKLLKSDKNITGYMGVIG